MEPNPFSSNTTEAAYEVRRGDTQGAAPKANLTENPRRAERTGHWLVRRLKSQLKPSLMAGVALTALAAAAGATYVMVRRSRRARWLPSERPSHFGVVVRGAGLFLLRLAARQAAQQLMARLESPDSSSAAAPPRPALGPAVSG